VGWFSSFGCHLDLTTSNVGVSQQKTNPVTGRFFSLPQAGFSPKKRAKKMQISDFQNGVSGAKKMPAQEASKKITCDL
jgi:hypothetical protein